MRARPHAAGEGADRRDSTTSSRPCSRRSLATSPPHGLRVDLLEAVEDSSPAEFRLDLPPIVAAAFNPCALRPVAGDDEARPPPSCPYADERINEVADPFLGGKASDEENRGSGRQRGRSERGLVYPEGQQLCLRPEAQRHGSGGLRDGREDDRRGCQGPLVASTEERSCSPPDEVSHLRLSRPHGPGRRVRADNERGRRRREENLVLSRGKEPVDEVNPPPAAEPMEEAGHLEGVRERLDALPA